MEKIFKMWIVEKLYLFSTPFFIVVFHIMWKMLISKKKPLNKVFFYFYNYVYKLYLFFNFPFFPHGENFFIKTHKFSTYKRCGKFKSPYFKGFLDIFLLWKRILKKISYRLHIHSIVKCSSNQRTINII